MENKHRLMSILSLLVLTLAVTMVYSQVVNNADSTSATTSNEGTQNTVSTTTNSAQNTLSISNVDILMPNAVTKGSLYKLLGPGTASTGPNLVPTFEHGFSAGLRAAPAQCFTQISADDLKSKSFSSNIQKICQDRNPRKGFCVTYCINEANRARRALRIISLKNAPKADCLKPINKVYSSPNDCMKERMIHCSINCYRGQDQNKCSRAAQVYCRRQGGNPFVLNVMKKS